MIIGIDPGITGAYALFDPPMGYLRTASLPTLWRIVNKKKRFEIDEASLVALFVTVHKVSPIETIICEEPHALPNAGVSSMFNFGSVCGQLKAVCRVLQALGYVEHVRLVDPFAWKIKMGCPSDKNRTRELAMRLFPDHVDQFLRKSDDGKAEAALLAYYAAFGGTIPQKIRTAVKQKR